MLTVIAKQGQLKLLQDPKLVKQSNMAEKKSTFFSHDI